MVPQSQLRALFVINSLAGGGAERVFSTLVRELSAPGLRHNTPFAITVALLDDEAREAYTLPADVAVERLDTGGGMLRSITHLRRLADRLKPDVTVSFLSRANVAAVMAMGLTGRPAIISERVNTTAHLSTGRFSFLGRFLIRSCYPRARRIIAVSEGVARTLERDFAVSPERICVIYNPVDLARIRALAAGDPDISISKVDFVTMGRLVPNKNTALAIRALARSHSAGRLFVLGDGPLREELEGLVQELGLGARVVFAGFLPNPYAVLARAGCYLLTSDAEGFPNAMLEAMAAGLPVVATDCPSGPAEILEASLDGARAVFGTGGALVPMNDDHAMAECMDKLIDPALRERVSAEGMDRVEAFSVDRAVGSFRQTILDAVGSTGVEAR